MRLIIFALSSLLLCSVAQAEPPGGAVPPMETPSAPIEVAPRDEHLLERQASSGGMNDIDAQNAVITRFFEAYHAQQQPRLLFSWSRSLSGTLDQRVSTHRVLSARSGDTATVEYQTRRTSSESESDQGRFNEAQQWEFQDGFMEPFLTAGAIVIDKGSMASSSENGDVAASSRGQADYLVQVLTTLSENSTTGYEVLARVTEIRSGRVIANINSRNLESWQTAPASGFAPGPQGYVRVDEDSELVGPQAGTRYRADAQGYVKHNKPPKLRVVAADFAINVMKALTRSWGG
ncbi:putative FlgO domain-containing protein [Azospirillaceae bacterium]